MINAKSNSVEKNLLVDNDLTFTRPSISTDSKVKEVSYNFLSYNSFFGVFGGYLKMHACQINANDTIITLPVHPKWANVYLSAKVNSTVQTFYIDQYGNLKKQTEMTFEEDDYIFVNGIFPIGGGVTLKGLLSKIKHFFHREEVLV